MTTALVELRQLHEQLESYRISHGTYPQSLEVLRDGGRFVDAWGQRYVYNGEGGNLILYSVGKNGADEGGEGDDVVSGERLRREFYPELDPRPAVRRAMPVAIAVGVVGWLWFYVHRKRVAA